MCFSKLTFSRTIEGYNRQLDVLIVGTLFNNKAELKKPAKQLQLTVDSNTPLSNLTVLVLRSNALATIIYSACMQQTLVMIKAAAFSR